LNTCDQNYTRSDTGHVTSSSEGPERGPKRAPKPVPGIAGYSSSVFIYDDVIDSKLAI